MKTTEFNIKVEIELHSLLYEDEDPEERLKELKDRIEYGFEEITGYNIYSIDVEINE